MAQGPQCDTPKKSFNENISKNEVLKYFGDKVKRDKNGNLSQESQKYVWVGCRQNNWFTATYPYSQAYLKNRNGKITCFWVGSDRKNAVVLFGVDARCGEIHILWSLFLVENNKGGFLLKYMIPELLQRSKKYIA